MIRVRIDLKMDKVHLERVALLCFDIFLVMRGCIINNFDEVFKYDI